MFDDKEYDNFDDEQPSSQPNKQYQSILNLEENIAWASMSQC